MAYRHKVDESGAIGEREDALPPRAEDFSEDPYNAVARWSDGVEWKPPGCKASPTAKKPPMLELHHAGKHGKVRLQAVEQKGKTLLILSHTDEHGVKVQVAQVVLSSLPAEEHARAKDFMMAQTRKYAAEEITKIEILKSKDLFVASLKKRPHGGKADETKQEIKALSANDAPHPLMRYFEDDPTGSDTQKMAESQTGSPEGQAGDVVGQKKRVNKAAAVGSALKRGKSSCSIDACSQESTIAQPGSQQDIPISSDESHSEVDAPPESLMSSETLQRLYGYDEMPESQWF